MNKYKLLACDVDGTLLNSQGIITNNTIEKIKAMYYKDVIFSISTGRSLIGIKFLIELFDFDIPCVTFNGALVITSKSHKKIYEKCLESSDALKIIDFAIKNDVSFITWQGEKLYSHSIDSKVLNYAKMSKVEPIQVDDFTSLANEGLHKVLFYDDVDEIANIQRKMKEEAFEKVDYYTSLPHFLEFVNSEASKAIGLEKLGEVYNVKQSEIIAVGDGYNDLSMIQYAGLGVVMDNAKEAIKEEADFITLSNNNEGVAHVIDKFILNKLL